MEREEMQRGLKPRHVEMIALGGTIGVGLFMGSANTIMMAGPAVLLCYALTGVVMFFIMRIMGEMLYQEPVTGSFATYGHKYISPYVGYLTAWSYWFMWVVIGLSEITAVGIYVHYWFPDIPQWISAFAGMLIVAIANLAAVKYYGEFEFWFAFIKVTTIVVMLFVGAAVIIFGFGNEGVPVGIDNLWVNGGFMPNGFGAVLSAMLITMFSFMGAEIVTIAAAESDTPDKHIVRATNSVIWRISIFYLCSIFIVVALIPWNMPGLKSIGSYRSVLELLHIPYAKLIMDGVILLSVTSCLNSALYTASRMLYSLSRRGDAPAIMGRTNRSKTPYVAVLLSTGAAFLTVVVNYYAPAKVFKFLIDSSGAIALLVYLVIAVSQLRMRKILQAQGGEIRLRMWLYPYLTWLVIAFITFVLVVMLFRPAQQLEVISTGLLALGIICTVPIMSRWKKLVLWQKLPLQNTR